MISKPDPSGKPGELHPRVFEGEGGPSDLARWVWCGRRTPSGPSPSLGATSP
jgi:hypothetical protein